MADLSLIFKDIENAIAEALEARGYTTLPGAVTCYSTVDSAPTHHGVYLMLNSGERIEISIKEA